MKQKKYWDKKEMKIVWSNKTMPASRYRLLTDNRMNTKMNSSKIMQK